MDKNDTSGNDWSLRYAFMEGFRRAWISFVPYEWDDFAKEKGRGACDQWMMERRPETKKTQVDESTRSFIDLSTGYVRTDEDG